MTQPGNVVKDLLAVQSSAAVVPGRTARNLTAVQSTVLETATGRGGLPGNSSSQRNCFEAIWVMVLSAALGTHARNGPRYRNSGTCPDYLTD